MEVIILKKTMTITKKESRHLQLNEITMSKQELFYMVKDELLKFYTHKLTDLDSYSNPEKEQLLNIIQNVADGKYNQMINNKIPKGFSFKRGYNAKVIIEDNLEDYVNPEITINLKLSWLEALGL